MKLFVAAAALGLAALAFNGATHRVKPTGVGTDPGGVLATTKPTPKKGDRLAAFSAGCFWGVEGWFRKVPGVVATTVGYTGGHTENPTYEDVCSHTTGHAETVLVEFDPKKVSYERLLEIFWSIHDPMQVGGQGPDIGDSYRSAVWTYGDDELAAAKRSLAAQEKAEGATFTTTVKPAAPFWVAEGYHQQYAKKTGHDACPSPRRPVNLTGG